MIEKRQRSIAELMADDSIISAALGRAVRQALLEHAREGQPVATWRDEKVVWIPPAEILAQLSCDLDGGEEREEVQLNQNESSSRLQRDVRTGENSMNQTTPPGTGKRWKASELRRLPAEQRDAIVEAAARLAEDDYRNDPELTAFEAFGRDDLYGDSASSQGR